MGRSAGWSPSLTLELSSHTPFGIPNGAGMEGGEVDISPTGKKSEVSEAKRKPRVGNSEGGPLKSQAKPITRSVDNSGTHSLPAPRQKKHRIAGDSDGPQKSVPKHNNLNVYRELLRAFHSDSCMLTAKRLEILRAVVLELGITESDHVVAIQEIVLSASASGSGSGSGYLSTSASGSAA